jgi:hypothetical protein
MQEKGLDARDAYALASIAVDFRVAEAGESGPGHLRHDSQVPLQEEAGLLVQAIAATLDEMRVLLTAFEPFDGEKL